MTTMADHYISFVVNNSLTNRTYYPISTCMFSCIIIIVSILLYVYHRQPFNNFFLSPVGTTIILLASVYYGRDRNAQDACFEPYQ